MVITFDLILSSNVMSITNFNISFNQGNNTAIIHNNMNQFGVSVWGAFSSLHTCPGESFLTETNRLMTITYSNLLSTRTDIISQMSSKFPYIVYFATCQKQLT